MLGLFAITIFTGATLLFLVQPMIAKMVLPLLGGSPSVWNTCMVFFQALLLAGYAYAHWSVKALGLRRQVLLHGVVLLIPLGLWAGGIPPISKPLGIPTGDYPILWLLKTLAVCIGPAFLVVSTCGPLMQRWFSGTGHAAAKDPYFLYAASNGGSMIALLAYPLLIEPMLTLAQQRRVWSVGYVLFAALSLLCAVRTHRSKAVPLTVASEGPAEKTPARQRLRWVLLALVPSSFMLAVTQYLSTDIAAIPLLWIVPLAIYLLTFILAFSKWQLMPLHVLSRFFPILAIALGLIFLLSRHDPMWIIIMLNLAALFMGCLMCHVQLARARPGPSGLTGFYLLIALGGVLGGMFNALLAPVIFKSLLEYPIILAAACMLRPASSDAPRSIGDKALDAGLAVIPFTIWVSSGWVLATATVFFNFLGRLGLPLVELSGDIKLLFTAGLPVLVCYLLVRRPIRLGAGLGILLVGCALVQGSRVQEIRTFFGAYTVEEAGSESHRMRQLLHGTTLHGAQWLDPARRSEPLIYYHRKGPIGAVFQAFGAKPLFDQVALVGLGAGTLTSYGRAGQTLTVFEIDPAVIKLASNPANFTYIQDCRAKVEFVLGDARQSLAAQPDGKFGLIVLDAFSSDAVPVHLLTAEAVKVYASKLKPGGLLAFHISNRYLDLQSVLVAVAANLSLTAIVREDYVDDTESRNDGHWNSTWVCMSRQPEDLAPLEADRNWSLLARQTTDLLWTDDYSSFVGIFRWVKP